MKIILIKNMEKSKLCIRILIYNQTHTAAEGEARNFPGKVIHLSLVFRIKIMITVA